MGSLTYLVNGADWLRDVTANAAANGVEWTLDQLGKGAGKLNRSKDMDGSLVANKDINDGSTYGAMRNVVKDYRWTLSKTKNRDDVPYIRLMEFRANETVIQKQINLYSQLAPSTIGNAFGATQPKASTLQPYEEIFPKTDPTGFSYWFPYFSKTSLELTTPNWEKIDGAAGAIMKTVENMAETWLGKGAGEKASMISSGFEAAATAANIAAAAQYPVVGAFDRPRIFTSHSERAITISFPLFNTVEEGDWVKNRELIYLLMEQNLYNKRDYTTGLPPVFYDVYIPGQYYCFASCITQINVENLGNTRLLYNEFIVPDAYQVTLTLSEMTMPSKNQFAAIFNGEARNQVKTSTVGTATTNTPSTSNATFAATPPPQNRGEGAARRAAEIRDTNKPSAPTWSATSSAPPRNRGEAAARNAAARAANKQ